MDQDLIKMSLEAENEADVIAQLGAEMQKKGYVRESYIAAVMEREAELPTGLDINGFSVAIPHTDPEHVNQAAFAVGILKNPVPFHCMAMPDVYTPVRLVFLLAIKDPEKQVALLQQLMAVFQDVELLQAILQAETKSEIAQKLAHIRIE